MDSFQQGEDISRTVTLTIDSAIADTANFTAIDIRVYHKKTRKQISAYSFADGTVTKDTPTTSGIISFIVLRTENQTVHTGIYSYEIETVETDTDYPSNERHRKFIGDCFRLTKTNE